MTRAELENQIRDEIQNANTTKLQPLVKKITELVVEAFEIGFNTGVLCGSKTLDVKE